MAICPAARSAMVYALDEEKREKTAADLVEDLTDVDGIDLVSRRLNGEAAVPVDQGRAALRPRRGPGRRPRRHAGAWRATPRCWACAPPTAAVSSGSYPRPARPPVVCPDLRPVRRRPAVGHAGLRVRRLGRLGPRGRRQPRLAARQRLGGRPDHARDRSRLGRGQAELVDARRGADGPRPLRGTVVGHAGAHEGPPGIAPPAQLGAAGQVLRGRRLGLRGQPDRLHAGGEGAGAAPSGRRHAGVRGGGVQQLPVEPPLDLRRAPRATPASRPRASSPSAWPPSCSPPRCSSCWSAGSGSPRSRPRPSRSWRPPRSTSSGTRCGASRSAHRLADSRCWRSARWWPRRAPPRPTPSSPPPSRSLPRATSAAPMTPRGSPIAPARCAGRAPSGRRLNPTGYTKGPGRWQVSYFEGRARGLPGPDRRPQRGDPRGVGRPPGGVDHGAWLRGPVRPQPERAVAVDPAVRPVPRAVRRPSPALPVAPPGPAGAAGLQRLALLLQPGRDRGVGAAGRPGAPLPAGAPRGGRLPRRASAASR